MAKVWINSRILESNHEVTNSTHAKMSELNQNVKNMLNQNVYFSQDTKQIDTCNTFYMIWHVAGDENVNFSVWVTWKTDCKCLFVL